MKKNILSCLIAAACVVPALVGCGATTGSATTAESGSETNSTSTGEKTAEFSYWQGNGDDAFYTDYSDNPIVRYLTQFKKWGVNKDTKIKFDFQIPPSGEQATSVNTMIGSGDVTDIIDVTYYKQIGSVTDLYNDGTILDSRGKSQSFYRLHKQQFRSLPMIRHTARAIQEIFIHEPPYHQF
jgi:ABC-type glycerol-3-phosphate transport system substrate-binding protein